MGLTENWTDRAGARRRAVGAFLLLKDGDDDSSDKDARPRDG